MRIELNSVLYSFKYFPFFKTETHEDFDIFCMRLPSGNIEEVIVFDKEAPMNCLRDYSEFLIKEYILEDDIMLTPRALEFKKDLIELFGLSS